MKTTLGLAGGVAVLIVVVFLFLGTKTSSGKIGKIRVQKITDDVSLVVFDFNIKNDSGKDMIVHSITGTLETPDGNAEGTAVAASDLNGAFREYPGLGNPYNPVLKDRDEVPAHQSVDRMVGLRFDAPEKAVEARKKLVLKIEDVSGYALELQ